MAESTRMLLGLAIGIILMIVLVSKTKVHTFIALLVAAMVTGLIGGMLPGDVTVDGVTKTGIITAIQNGFGNTLRSTGIIIGLGVMMGGILEKSGAAEKMAYSFIQAVGKKKEEWALAITGWFIAIPVFADSAIVIFAPLCKAISKVTGKSLVGLALAMAAGLQLTHCLVPPTPGPTTAASMLGVDVGQMILMGALISIPMLIVAVFYCMWIGKKIYQVPTDDGGFERKEFKQEYIKSMEELNRLIGEKQLPSLGWSIAPIVVPLVLILTKTILDFTGHSNQVITFLGAPIVALGIGTLLAIYGLMGKADTKEVLKIMDDAIKDTGIIMLITGAGGSLGNVISVSGIGNALGELVLSWPIPAVIIPFIIAAMMRIALGSATVA
ncbi:MAG: GntP family permease, partial [Oscillibacter sp.]|nr:GntP family permease [Oscillibacter sp.]